MSLKFVDFLSGGGLYLADGIVVLILSVWLVVDSILLSCSKSLRSGKFGYVSLVLSIVFSAVLLFNFFYLLVEGFDSPLMLLCCVVFAALVVSVLALGDSFLVGDKNGKRDMQHNVIKAFLGILIAASIACIVFGWVHVMKV